MLDDDRETAEMVTQVLHSDGHEVLTSTDLQGAPADAAIDCVITDLIAVRSYQLAPVQRWIGEIRARYPLAPVLVLSGHAEVERDAALLGADRVMTKPFVIDELGAAVAEVLADHKTPRHLASGTPLVVDGAP